MEYRTAPEVARIGRQIVAEEHTHLLNVRVEYVFLSKTPKSKGKAVWGRAKKVSGLSAFLAFIGGGNTERHAVTYEDQAPDFFVIEISEEVWDALPEPKRRALVDHELSHCWVEWDDEGEQDKLSIVGHDVTEFEAILRRHGLWNEDVEDFVKAGAEQLTLEGAVSS